MVHDAVKSKEGHIDPNRGLSIEMATELCPDLIMLHAATIRDNDTPGFQGRLGVGIDKRDTTYWWICKFSESVESWLTSEWPGELDCTFLLESDGVSATLRHVAGDIKVWSKFLKRYRKYSMVSIRIRSFK